MVLSHTTTHSYSHPFPTVTLAFFLRYYSPQLNPFSSHVLSTDTISSQVDPETGRLYTTRLHVKRSRMPKAVFHFLPVSVTGGAGDKSAYVLETSVVDIKEGWMKTESRNLNFASVLSVVELQHYTATPPDQAGAAGPEVSSVLDASTPASASPAAPSAMTRPLSPNTHVTTSFLYRSNFGNRKMPAVAEADAAESQASEGRLSGWISGWGAQKIQGSIESIASNKTDDQMVKSRDGMRLVLERLRQNGVVAVLNELRRREGKSAFER